MGVMRKQVLRSGTSPGANHREATRARSDAEFISCLGICLKELDETDYWLDLIDATLTTPNPEVAALRDETNQLIAILTTIVKKRKAARAKKP